MGSPITFAGEPPRNINVSDVGVVVQGVDGQVAGVRADPAKLQGPLAVRGIVVHAGDVDSDGAVAGVELAERYRQA